MAWIPKGNCRDKNNVQDSIARKIIEVKKEKTEVNKQLSRRSISAKENLRLAHHLYSSTMPSLPLSWSSPPGMIGYPPWTYFDPWMHHNYLYHGRVIPSQYAFDQLLCYCQCKEPKYFEFIMILLFNLFQLIHIWWVIYACP